MATPKLEPLQAERRTPKKQERQEPPKRDTSFRRERDTVKRERETFKRHASSPSINILSRVTSRTSLRSSSSDSSARAKSDEDTKKKSQKAGMRGGGQDRTTWRRIRDEDVPQILKNTLPATALPLLPSPEGQRPMPPPLPSKLPTIILKSRKTSDAIVQTEDLSTTSKTNSTSTSTSPTIENNPATMSEDASKLMLLRKFSAASGSNHHGDGGDSDGSVRSHSTASSINFSEGHSSGGGGGGGGVGHFRHSSPSKAVRVTPFNYIPSPMVCAQQDMQCQASSPFNEKPVERVEA